MNYFQKPGLSFHQLKDFATVSPSWYYRKYIKGEIQDGDKDSYRIGRLVHMAVLEPELFAKVPTVPAEHLTPSGTLSTKKETREWMAKLPNRDYGTPDELALCHTLAHNIHGHPEAGLIVSQSAVEIEHFADVDGIPCKGKADMIREFGAGKQVWDLKTTKNLDNIKAECRDFGYVEQIAWYARLFGVLPGGLIVIEKEEPHRILVVRFADDALERARHKLGAWCGLFRQCQESGEWPNHPRHPITLTAADLASA